MLLLPNNSMLGVDTLIFESSLGKVPRGRESTKLLASLIKVLNSSRVQTCSFKAVRRAALQALTLLSTTLLQCGLSAGDKCHLVPCSASLSMIFLFSDSSQISLMIPELSTRLDPRSEKLVLGNPLMAAQALKANRNRL